MLREDELDKLRRWRKERVKDDEVPMPIHYAPAPLDAGLPMNKRPVVNRPAQKIPLSLRPQPSGTTGPILSPQGETRARAAAMYGFSDETRQRISHTPIHLPEEMGKNIGGTYGDRQINLGRDMPPKMAAPLLQHEYNHMIWEQDLKGTRDPRKQEDFLRDTAYASRDNPGITTALTDWQRSGRSGLYGNDWRNLDITANETRARVAQFTPPGDMPAWYRDKWFPNLYRPNETQSFFPRQPGPPDATYNTSWGQYPVWRNQMNQDDSGDY